MIFITLHYIANNAKHDDCKNVFIYKCLVIGSHIIFSLLVKRDKSKEKNFVYFFYYFPIFLNKIITRVK